MYSRKFLISDPTNNTLGKTVPQICFKLYQTKVIQMIIHCDKNYDAFKGAFKDGTGFSNILASYFKFHKSISI